MLQAIGTAWLLLVLGDFFLTFSYYVPSYIHSKFHILIDHSPHRNYVHYAVLSKNPRVLWDGFLGVLPYLAMACLLWSVSWVGGTLRLALGQGHVWHVCALDWHTLLTITWLCRVYHYT